LKARDWRKYLESQRRLHGKTLFTLTELAHASGSSRKVLSVELHRLRRQGEIVRHARGLYGLADAVTPDGLLAGIDSHAYMTGAYALHIHNLITQMPTTITCFTDRRSPRARVRRTPLGTFVFVCVRSRVYSPPEQGPLGGLIAGAEQALCDFCYITRRRGARLAGAVTFRNLDRLDESRLSALLERYPSTVGEEVRGIIERSRARRG
jgi:hypothetical protein